MDIKQPNVLEQRSASPLVAFGAGRWKGHVHRGWQEVFNGVDPLERLLGWRHEQIHLREMSCTWRVDSPGQVVYAKYVCSSCRHGVKPGRFGARAKQMVFPSVALRTLRIRQAMTRRGLKVPETVLAARRRHGWCSEDLMVSTAVEGDSLTDLYYGHADVHTVLPFFGLAGRRVAQLHQSGFVHGHLLPGHIIVTPDRTDVTYIDNDETRWWPAVASGAARRRNLAQFVLRFVRGASSVPRGDFVARRFLDAYFDAMGFPARRRQRWRQQVLRDVHRRARKRLRKSARAAGGDQQDPVAGLRVV